MKAVAYCRVSTDDQQERGTIENQVEFANKYTDLHSIPLIKIYKDEGVSGTVPLEDRESGKELIEDARKGIFDTLLIYKLDRLGRSARITLNSIHLLEEYNIKIKSMTEPFDTENPSGRFMITMLAGVADLERSTILERMQYGTEKAAKEGKWLGGIVPYGYIVNSDKYLEINEEKMPCGYSEADIVRLIYDMLAVQKSSTIKIADFLNDSNIPTHYTKDNRKIIKGKRKVHTDGLWRPTRIGNLVRNTVYMGVHLYGKRSKKERKTIERDVPAIVSKDTYEQAIVTMRNNKTQSQKNTRNREYLLKGILKCGGCGRTYIGNSRRRKTASGEITYSYNYLCGGKSASYKYINEVRCKARSISAVKAENYVWEHCIKIINNPKLAQKEIDKKMNRQRKNPVNYSALIKELKNKLLGLENEKQNIMTLYRKNLITVEDVEKQMEEIEYERVVNLNKIKQHEDRINRISEINDSIKNLENNLLEYKKQLDNIDFNTKREIILNLIDRVILVSNHQENSATLEIEYLFLK